MNNNFIEETYTFHFTPQGKAKVMGFLSQEFDKRQSGDLITLRDLPADPEKLEGEGNFDIKPPRNPKPEKK